MNTAPPTVTELHVVAAGKYACVVHRAGDDPAEAVVIRRVAATLGVAVKDLNPHDRAVIWQAYREKFADLRLGRV